MDRPSLAARHSGLEYLSLPYSVLRTHQFILTSGCCTISTRLRDMSTHSLFSVMLSGLPNFHIHTFIESRPPELSVNMDHLTRSWKSAAFAPGLEDFVINATCHFFANSHGYCARKAYRGNGDNWTIFKEDRNISSSETGGSQGVGCFWDYIWDSIGSTWCWKTL